MATADATPDLVVLRELQSRALDAVARRWAPRPGRPGGTLGARTVDQDVLRRVVTTTGLLAEAARQAAGAATLAPGRWTSAVETADAVSTTAQALRMLAELELAAIPGP